MFLNGKEIIEIEMKVLSYKTFKKTKNETRK